MQRDEKREKREMRGSLSESIRSHYEPLKDLREERERLIRGAVELLLTLNEIAPAVRRESDLPTVLEWEQCRDAVQAFLAELRAPLALVAEENTTR